LKIKYFIRLLFLMERKIKKITGSLTKRIQFVTNVYKAHDVIKAAGRNFAKFTSTVPILSFEQKKLEKVISKQMLGRDSPRGSMSILGTT
jgi:hypothetical protein